MLARVSPAQELPSDWTGGLGYYGVEYWTGPSEADAHLVNEVNTVGYLAVLLELYVMLMIHCSACRQYGVSATEHCVLGIIADLL